MNKALLSGLRKNLILKIISLILAILLWYLISARGYSELTLQLPVELLNIPKGYEVIEKSVNRVNVSFLGSTKILRLLSPEQLRVSVDMRDVEKGTSKIILKPEDIKVPSAVRITEIKPATISVTIDRIAEKIVPVVLGLNDRTLSERYIFTVSPDTVTLRGPESIIKGVKEVRTEAFRIKRDLEGGHLKVTLTPPDERVQLSTNKVEVTFVRRQ